MRRNYNQSGWLAVPLVLSVAAGSLLVTACEQPEPAKTCSSPRAVSSPYPGDPSATKDSITWQQGVVARVTPPAEEADWTAVVGFALPGSSPERIRWKDSLPLTPEQVTSGIVAKIGNGPLTLSVRYVAPEGSPACQQAPKVDFVGPQSLSAVYATPPAPPYAQPEWLG